MKIQSIKIWLLLLFFQPDLSLSAETTYQVLIVHAYNQEYPWTKSQHNGFVERLLKQSEYSSLSYLKKLPVDELKIDRTFIRDIPENEDDVAIVRSVIALAKSMKIDVIAEGVETIEQLNFLRRENCSQIQGYLISKPKDADEVTQLLKNNDFSEFRG